MGITIHYRGTVDDLGRIEELEDRVTDLVFALGGQATIWRSFADHDPSRVVRGLMVDMAPGQETLSLLVSPEGHLTPLIQIEEAEQTPFEEPPYCSVKTQFGSLIGHVAIVHLLNALKMGYMSNLKVNDEGGYAESRDIDQLKHKMEFMAGAIASMADGFREHGLSAEAAEDQSIVASRIERIAQLVHAKIQGSASTSTGSADLGISEIDNLRFDDDALNDDAFGDDAFGDNSLEDEVAEMDRLRRHGDLRNERMARHIDEATAAGMSTEEAFRQAMQAEGLERPIDPGIESEFEQEFEDDMDEPWQASFPPNPFDETSQHTARDEHPALQLAEKLLQELLKLETSERDSHRFHRMAFKGVANMLGGLAQATSDDFEDRYFRALAISQLKRVLKGFAFTRGAVFALHSSEAIDQETSARLHGLLDQLLQQIHELQSDAWNEPW